MEHKILRMKELIKTLNEAGKATTRRAASS